MLAKIRRQIANPQTAVAVAIVGVRLDEFLERFGVLLVPAATFIGDGLGVITGMIVQRENEITVGLGKIGVEGDGLATGGDGFIELPSVCEDDAEIEVDFGRIGPEGDRLAVGGNGLIEFSLVSQ